VLRGHSRPITSVAFDPGGSVLYTCSKDKLVLAWSCPDGECLRRYEGHQGAVWACSVSPDSRLLLTCGADGRALLWAARSGELLAEAQLPGVARGAEWEPPPQPGRARCAGGGSGVGAGEEEVPRRRFVVCSNGFKRLPAALSVWEVDLAEGPTVGGAPSLTAHSPRQLLVIEEPALPSAASQVAWAVGAAAAAAAARGWPLQLCSAHEAGDVCLWDAGTGAALGSFVPHEGPVSGVALGADRRLMVTCGRAAMEVRLWDLAVAAEQWPAADGSGSLGNNSDENEKSKEGQVSWPCGMLLQRYLSDRPLNCVAARPSLTLEEAGGGGGGVGCSSSCVCVVGGGQEVRDVALVSTGGDDQFDPLPLRLGGNGGVIGDGCLEACGTTADGRRKARKGGGHFGPIHALAVSPDAAWCASGSEDGTVRLCELTP